MFKDHEFDPVTPEEEARRRQEEEFARRVRREVLRIERGEADEDIRADMEREEEEKAAASSFLFINTGNQSSKHGIFTIRARYFHKITRHVTMNNKQRYDE